MTACLAATIARTVVTPSSACFGDVGGGATSGFSWGRLEGSIRTVDLRLGAATNLTLDYPKRSNRRSRYACMQGHMQGRGVSVLLLRRRLGEVFAFDNFFPVLRELDVLLEGYILVQ